MKIYFISVKNCFIEKKLILLILYLLSLPSTISYSQVENIIFEHYNTDNGLSASIVRSIIQDRTGYLWFGTYSGLDRYDGISFKSYRNIPGDTTSLTNAFVQCLLEDKSGNMWVGTTNGLNKLDHLTGKFVHFKPVADSSVNEWSNNILAMCEDRYGYLWLGTGDGLTKFNPADDKFTHFRHIHSDTSSLQNNVINDILEDKNGTLWIGTASGLDKYNRETNTFTHYFKDPIYRDGFYDGGIKNEYRVNALHQDEKGTLWVATQDGLLEFHTEENKFNLYKSNPDDENSISFYAVTSICSEDTLSLWVGTWNGLNLFNKKTKKFFRIYHDSKLLTSLSHNSIAKVYRERSGTLWVATYGGGLNKVNRTMYPFKKYYVQSWKETNRFSSASIMNISKAGDGSIWIATPSGLMKFDPSTEKLQLNKIRQNIRLAFEDRRGDLWIGFNNSSGRGIVKLEKNGNIKQITDMMNKKFLRLVNQMIQENDSILWACTGDKGGVIKINTELNKFSVVYESPSTINTIYKDKSGLIWFGTRENGLFCMDPSKNKITQHFLSDPENPGSISGNSIMTIFEDANNDIWIGTNISLNKYNRTSNLFTHYTESDGLPHNWVSLIFQDDHKNLWIGTNKGITKFNPTTETFNNYDVLHGLVTADRAGVGCQTENREIYLDSPGGLIRFHPDSIKDNPYIPPVVITGITIDNNTLQMTDEIEIDSGPDHINIEFAALSYVRPEKNLYAYKLEGVDKKWINANTRRYAVYTNLKPGNYTFMVRGSNNDGIWNEKGTSLKIIVHPPWWRTWWAYIFYIILAIGILYSTWKLQLKRIHVKHALELSKMEADKFHHLEEIKTKFFTNISHEFRTPLTLIQGPAGNILETTDDLKVRKNALIIKRNANRMLGLINRLLDLSKIDSGKLRLKASYENIIIPVRGVAMSFKSLADMKGIEYKVVTGNRPIELFFDREIIEEILENLISNAFKFTPAGEQITIEVNQPSTEYVEIKIKNTGVGITEDQIKNIFDRFYQVDGSQTRQHDGSGLGLAVVKELVELHHGIIDVSSKHGEWTEFRVSLLKGKSHFKPEEIVEQGKKSKARRKYLFEEIKDSLVKVDNDDENKAEKELVLIVEDDEDVRIFIKDSLGNHFHYLEAENGKEGLKIAMETIPDMIITDIMMPVMDGNEMTRIIKANQSTSHIPVILLTAKTGQENKIDGLQTGADEYLTKPFDKRELRVRIENLIKLRRKLQSKFKSEKFIVSDDIEANSYYGKETSFIQRLIKVIEEHLSEEEFSIEDFGKEVGMSRSQMHRKLKALTGKSASQYIRSVRLSKAKKMIENREATISEVAYSVGFSSPSYFTKCFKEEYGYTPSEKNETNQGS
jgi:signal transduction histidine kinase/ligand-binding sensor domain-containing protein/DNA-binding response OmpR family regulator